MNRKKEHYKRAGNRWLFAFFIAVSFILLGILAYAVLTAAGIVQPRTENPFITITEPSNGAVLDSNSPLIILGQAGSLPEDTLVVQVLNSSGNVLDQLTTRIEFSENAGNDPGSWSVEMAVAAPPGTQGQIVVSSTSSMNGSALASASIEVFFGKSLNVEGTSDLRGHLWQLTSLYGEPLFEGTVIDLQFKDFLVEGSGGCNLYTASYERRRTNLNLGFVTSTAKECDIPPGILSQERSYFSALESAASFSTARQHLTMFDISGNPNLVYDALVRGSVVAQAGRGLPEDGLVTISLHDISIEDEDESVIADQIITDAIEFPVPFALKYDPRQIRQEQIYVVQVTIVDSQGNLHLATLTPIPVITRDNPSELSILVELIQ